MRMAAAQCLVGVPLSLHQDAVTNEMSFSLLDAEVRFIFVDDQEPVDEVFAIVKDLKENEDVTFLVAERPTNMALRYPDVAYLRGNGRVLVDGAPSDLTANEDVKEYYPGLSSATRKGFRDVKHYRRRKRGLS